MLQAKSRAEALQLNEEWYWTGKPCKRGHVDYRYTSTANCITCAKSYSKTQHEWLAANDPEYARRRALRDKYGLSLHQYNSMLQAQDSKCVVCKETFCERAFVDHCHRTGNVRALLCRGCNTALGHSRDNPEILRALALYIEHHKSQQVLS